MHKQAVHIQSLIPENSRLNIKLLLESTEVKELKKPCGDFGKFDYNSQKRSNFSRICALMPSTSLIAISTITF